MSTTTTAAVGLEICLDSVESAIIAEKSGAIRVELCDNVVEGGTTPSIGMIKEILKHVRIPVHVMIRPRGGDFCYSDIEYQVMKSDIESVKETGAAGIVIGLLNPNGTIDKKRTKSLVQLAKPLKVTFHRAFDMTKDAFHALEDLISIGGIDRILTSGQDNSVLEGLPLIKQLVEKSTGRILIMPGCGITSRNVQRILTECPGLTEIHIAAPIDLPSKMEYKNSNVFMGTAITTPEYTVKLTNGNVVKDVVRQL